MLNVPNGFRNLLECLTFEVMRENPINIPKFAADYFKERLTARQEKGYDDCLLGSQIDGFYRYQPSRTDNMNKLLNQTLQESLDNASDTFQPQTKSTKIVTSEHLAASKLPTGFHHWKAREESNIQNGSAEKIHADYHGYECHKEITNQNKAATRIQAGFKGYKVRKATKTKNSVESSSQTRFKDQSEALIKAQTEFRGHQINKEGVDSKINDRREAGKIKKKIKTSLSKEFPKVKLSQRLTDEDEAAKRVQAGYRGYRRRKGVANQVKASTIIQANYRGYRVRKELGKKNDASVIIQAVYRGYHERKKLKRKHKASTTIQAGYRGYRVRKNNSQSEAAIKIQARYRGYRLRTGLIQSCVRLLSNNPKALGIAHDNNRNSFSLPKDVKFDGDLDSDSDTDIDKVIKSIEEKKIGVQEDKKDDANIDGNQI